MRRAGIAALHAALLLGAASAGSVALGAPGPAARAFDPPTDRPMLLSRTLRRDLADGKAIVTVRRYRVSFTATATGWTVDGELVDSEVTAPPPLAALAEIERKRADDGLFPLTLDRAGLIVPRTTAPGGQGRAAVDDALALTLARIKAQPPAGVGAPIVGFVQQLQALAAQAALTRWPEALFTPGVEASGEQRFALPDGAEGSVITKIRTDGALEMGTMNHATRAVTTEIAGNRRVTREEWSLTPLAG
ncbi:MAG TPA: hypothetical protein VM055_06065 [Novosphingobium sp.]|nr:hypothetical protein [Novosphingobium sp.]